MDVVRLLQELVRIPSVNPTYPDVAPDIAGEDRMAEYLAGLLAGLDFDVQLQEPLPSRPTLVARRGPTNVPAVCFCSHMDTVPVEGMVIPPFAGELRDGSVWGRGACDTKASIAAIVSAVSDRSVRDVPVVLVLTCDEEATMTGVRHALGEGLGTLLGVVVGEPTSGQLAIAHKGVYRTKIHTEGKSAHAATPQLGSNAIYRMGLVLQRLEKYATGLSLRPPHSALATPTLNVGTIVGGSAANSVPDHCEIDIDRRTLPEETPEQIAAELADALADIDGVRIDPKHAVLPGYGIDVHHPWVQCVAGAVGNPRSTSLPYATDGAFFARTGVPTVIFGPGQATDAHTCDEHVGVKDVETFVRHYTAILRSAPAASSPW